MKRIIFLLALLFSSQSFAVQEPLNILFIGNSFTHMNSMPKQFDHIATSLSQKVFVDMSAKSNHTLKMHCGRPELFEKINSKKWDFVIIQPFSRELLFNLDSLNQATIPYFKQILDSIYKNNACTNVLLYQTWGYKFGFSERVDTDSFDEMTMKLENGFRYMSDTFNIPIVPVGMVWREIVNKHPSINLYDKDHCHPSPIGSYLVACTFYASIFKKSLDGAASEGFPVAQITEIQKTAYNYVLMNVDDCKLRQNSYFIAKETDSKKRYKVACKAYYENADSLKWEFGDGKVSKLAVVDHIFKLPGTYKVKLTVYDACGIRFYERDLAYVAPPKKKTKKPTTKN